MNGHWADSGPKEILIFIILPTAAAVVAAILAYCAISLYVIQQAEAHGDSALTTLAILTISIVAGLLTLLALFIFKGKLHRLVDARTSDLECEIAERKQAEQKVMELNRELEKRVRERTDQLEEAMVEQFCLNEQLGLRTNALEEANRSLETFSITISHDLRAPLRQVAGFSEILANEHTADLSPEGKQLLHRIRKGCRRMDELIDGILRFSRIDLQELQKVPVDTVALVNEVLAELPADHGSRSVELTVGVLPQCSADPVLLKQVFANLLGNAFKYSRQKDVAKIEVGSISQGEELVFFVRDNGAGFDMAYADRLFGIFQRLHGSEFEGTGIGLATSKRIVDRHGGRIWAEAVPDEGATFYFTIGS